MKKVLLLATVFCIFCAASAVSAQVQEDNFSGNWQLDLSKSKLPERMRVESLTMKVAQTDQDIKVETSVRRATRSEGENRPGQGNGGMRPGGMSGGNGTVVYSLVEGARKGNVIKPENALENPSAPAPRAAALKKDGKLKLNSTRTMNSQMGEVTVTTEETWELVDGGSGLKVTRKTETPRGEQVSEMYFTKKASVETSGGQAVVIGNENTTIAEATAGETSQTPKTLSIGLLNGKAIKLVLPAYPTEARATRAGGGVNVQVMIDEDGKVISAKAISGDESLKAASEEAVRNSKFAPTKVDGVPVKVTGVVYYNFVP